MGFEFKSEESRNPSNIQGPGGPKAPTLNCEEELKLINQFLEDNGYAHLYDHYKVIIAMKAAQEVIDREHNGFEEVE